MKRLFEANEKELSDLRGDPNFVLKVQSLIKEAFSATKQRQNGISDEIVNDFGAFALPGIISSTYIFSKEFEKERNMHNWIVGLLHKLIRDNEAAKRLLVISGLARSPFKNTQLITLDVLKTIENLSLAEEEMEALNDFFRISIGRDNKVLINVLEILWKLKPEKYFEISMQLLENNLRSIYKDDLKSGRELADKIIKYFPEKSYKVFKLIFNIVGPKEKEASDEFSNINLREENLTGLFTAANEILREQQRNKVIELIFQKSLARLFDNKPELIENYHNNIFNTHHHLIRYWLQAVGANFPKEFTVNYYKNHAFSSNEPEAAKWIVVQLLFREKIYEAKQLLMKIQQKNSEGYNAGKFQFDKFIKPNVTHTKIKSGKVEPDTEIRRKR